MTDLITIFHINWNDVLIPQIFPKLSLKDCFNLRCVCKDFMLLTDQYFLKMKYLRIPKKTFPVAALKVLTIHCANLRSLILHGCIFITDEVLIPLLKNNVHLVHVDLCYCKAITACSLQPIIIHCLNLKILNLFMCQWLTTGAVEALVLHHNHMEKIDLSYCNGISEACLILLIKKFKKLRSLSFEGHTHVGDKCLHAIAKNLKFLKHLNVEYCFNITDEGISDVVANCPSLDTLYTKGCMNVTELSLGPLRGKVRLDRIIPKPLAARSYKVQALNFLSNQ